MSSLHPDSKVSLSENCLRIISFSDWRSQSLKSILEFVKSVRPSPDLVLYAGDDTRRFIEFNSEIPTIFTKQYFIPIPKLAKKGKITVNMFYKDLEEEYSEFQDFHASIAKIKIPKDNILRTFHNKGLVQNIRTYNVDFMKTYLDTNFPTVLLYLGEDSKPITMDLSAFYKEFSQHKDFFQQFQYFPKIERYSIRFNEKYLCIKCEQADRSFEINWRNQVGKQPISFETRSYLNNKKFNLFKGITKLIETDNSFRTFKDTLHEKFNLEIFDISTFPILKGKSHDFGHYEWIAILKPKDYVLNSYITTNYFELLANQTSKGLFAVIGNDCRIDHKILIHGKNVFDLGDKPIILDNFALLGLEGVESITKR